MDETNRAIRRPTKLEEVCEIATASIDEVASVVNTFRESGRSFLFPPAGIALMSDTIIDISHESLIRNWTRLNKWLEEEMKSAAIYERLAETAVLHKQGMAALFKGPELNLTFEWFKYQRPNRAWALRYHPEFELAMVFLEQSKMASDRENELFSERLSIDKKKIEKRYKKAIVILILIFIIVLTLVIYWK
jgi:hypothetical protein